MTAIWAESGSHTGGVHSSTVGDLTSPLLDHVTDAVITTNLDLIITSWNAAAAALYGFREGEALGVRLPDLIKIEHTPGQISRLTANGQDHRYIAIRTDRNGHRFPVRVKAVSLRDDAGNRCGYLFLKTPASNLVQPAGQMALFLDSAGVSQYLNREAIAFFGEGENGSPIDVLSKVHPDDLSDARATLRDAVQRPGHVTVTTFRLRHADGTWRWVEASVRHPVDAADLPGIAVSLRDVTTRREALAALEDQQKLTQTILDHIPVMISMLDPSGRLIYLNPEAERVLGWTEKEVREHPDIMSALTPDAETRASGNEFVLRAEHRWADWRVTTKSGNQIDTRWMNFRVGELLLGIGFDCSDKKRAEEDSRRVREDVEQRVERKMPRAAPYGLTFRELTVLALMATGKTDREIAQTLSIGYRTVQTHISNILAKMGAKVRTEAGVRAVREGIID